MVGAQVCFVLAGLQKTAPKTRLIIAEDKEQAAYLQNSLASIIGEARVRFFPDSFKRPGFFGELNQTNVLARTECIARLQRFPDGYFIVSYPEALFEQVVRPKELEKSVIHIIKEENLDVDFLLDVLIEYGFERVDFVYEPGQFSIRGGIVDIFSFGNELPYRVELFDDEVESIRVFDPLSQLSKQNISRVTIIPNVNSQFERDEKTSLFEILPAEAAEIWIHDYQAIIDKIQTCFENASKLAEEIDKIDDEIAQRLLQNQSFLLPNVITSGLDAFSLIEYGRQRTLPVQKEIGQISFQAKPQPSFNKNFNLLIDQLRINEKGGMDSFIFTEMKKQIQRFDAIFEDLEANVQYHPVLKGIHEGFHDEDLQLAIYTDHQIFERFHRYKIKKGYSKTQALNVQLLRELKRGDFVTHIDHGIGVYSGLERLDINGNVQESIRLKYANGDLLYVGINSLHKISRYIGKEGTKPKLHRLGSDTWKTTRNRTKKKVKDIAKELIKLYAQRKASKGYAFPEDGYMQHELEASFIYEDTPDQFKATQETKADMQAEHPMDRLICGDVGFGKTEIAIRAAFKAVIAGKQVAILVPTTILALQHAKTFKERLGPFGVKVDYVNRFRTTKEKRLIGEALAEGKIDLLIGTHAILNKSLKWKDLGLLVIDEEQKFGVGAKEKLRNIKVNVDTLTLTATPIPRTLQFSLMAARDLSVINTPPPNRQPIYTEIRMFNDDLIKEAIEYEVLRGGQVFFVHNRVQSLPDICAMIRRLNPQMEVAMAHGQMDAGTLENTLVDFIDGKYDVLVCTNIIETGLDIANANTIIINNAHQFGLSDLHQLRGRVGRSNRKAFCYLFAPPLSTLSADSRKRLRTLEEYSDLGSGFNIAMRDLDIRGAGNLLGGEQSGFISDIGYETYQKILSEAIMELKEDEFKEMFKEEVDSKKEFVHDVLVETDVEMLIPHKYVSSIQERLQLYTALNQLKTEEEIDDFESKLIDRFGPIPGPVVELFEALRIQWKCKQLGFDRIMFKGRKMRAFFVNNPGSPFYDTKHFQNLIQFIATANKGFTFKQTEKYFQVIYAGLTSLAEVNAKLDELLASLPAKADQT